MKNINPKTESLDNLRIPTTDKNKNENKLNKEQNNQENIM